MEIISKRKRNEVTEFSLFFQTADDASSGYSFPCDADGRVDVASLNEAAARNYRGCAVGAVGFSVLDPVLKKRTYTYSDPAIGKCVCGRKVWLDSFTNGCDCGRDYNMSGQLLAPRSQWGEETGESYSDIVNHDYGQDW